ncbi:MAG TPA: DUF4231 domain-containing protein [Bryobacteraceae bacterium]|jgi:hypothetical protein
MADLNSNPTPEQVTLARLEDQAQWYSSRSRRNQQFFKWMKGTTIAAAAVIPVLTTSGVPHGAQIAAGLGVLIAIIEGLQQLNQYQTNWTSYRATAEALKHEKYLYLAKAGPYLGAAHPGAMLAERVESLVSQENAKWFTAQNVAPKDRGQEAEPSRG